jgi:hypothetical protein
VTDHTPLTAEVKNGGDNTSLPYFFMAWGKNGGDNTSLPYFFMAWGLRTLPYLTLILVLFWLTEGNYLAAFIHSLDYSRVSVRNIFSIWRIYRVPYGTV